MTLLEFIRDQDRDLFIQVMLGMQGLGYDPTTIDQYFVLKRKFERQRHGL